MLYEPKEIGAQRRLLFERPPSVDQTLLSRVARYDLGFASAIVIEKVSHRGIEGGRDPSEPIERDAPPAFFEIREGPW
jgi:hypothetical protein